MSAKLLLICSDPSAFTKEVKYALKDRFKIYSSEENREYKDADKRIRINSSNLCIIDAIHDRGDLKLITDLVAWKKIAVLRNHESRTCTWVCQNAIVFDAVCKYKHHELLTNFESIDTLIQTLKTSELEVEGDWTYLAKKVLKSLLFCLTYAK